MYPRISSGEILLTILECLFKYNKNVLDKRAEVTIIIIEQLLKH